MSDAQRSLAEHVRAFWVAPSRGSSAALFRVVYGLLALWTALGVLLNVERYYGDDGLVPWSAVESFPEQVVSLFSLAPHSAALPWLLAAAFALAALGITLGLWPRLCALAIFALNLSLQLRNPYVCNAGDRLFLIFAALAVTLPLAERWSLEAWFRRRRGLEATPSRIWGQRLVALQTCYVYLFAALAKLPKPQWRDGSALFDVLSSSVLSDWQVGPALVPILRVLTWSTLAFELSFPLLVWSPRLRPYVLVAGILFHAGIEITMAIPMFSAIMITSYACFLSDDESERLISALRSKISTLIHKKRPLEQGSSV